MKPFILSFLRQKKHASATRRAVRRRMASSVGIDALEPRMLLTTLASNTVDAGDFYMVGGERHDLLRVVGESSSLSGTTTPVLTTPDGGRLFPTDEVNFRYEGTDVDSVLASFSQVISAEPIRYSDNLYVASVAVTDGLDALTVSRQLDAHPDITWAEPNFAAEVERTLDPNDPGWANQWNLNDDPLLGGPDLGAEDAWDETIGSGVVVAVFDDGFELTHPDLNYWENPWEANGLPNIDDDGNGYIDDIHGVDVHNNDGDPSPHTVGDFHGTRVAGVVAAIGNNGNGIAGTAFNAEIMAIKIFTDVNGTLQVNWNQVAQGIYYAAEHGAVISNHSWSANTASQVVDQALNDVAADGMLTFASSGNDSDISPTGVNWPASLDSVVAVGASTTADQRRVTSNGGTDLQFVAPGQDIDTTAVGGGIVTGLNGTSYASPYAAGAAALIKSVHDYSATEILDYLTSTTDQIGNVPYVNGRNNEYGFGRINVGDAVQNALDDTPYANRKAAITVLSDEYAGPNRISWTGIAGTANYFVAVQNLATGDWTYYPNLGTATSLDLPGPLDFGRNRIWVGGSTGAAPTIPSVNSAWSDVIVTVSNELLSPVSETEIGTNPTFEWEPVQGAAYYRLYVSVPGEANIDETQITGTSWSPSEISRTLGPKGQAVYRWWVLPYDADDQRGEWSEHADFNIQHGHFSNITETTPGSFDLSWWEADGAVQYTLLVTDVTGLDHSNPFSYHLPLAYSEVITNISQTSVSLTGFTSGRSYRFWIGVTHTAGQNPLYGYSDVFTIAALDRSKPDSSDTEEFDLLFAEFDFDQLAEPQGARRTNAPVTRRDRLSLRLRDVDDLRNVSDELEVAMRSDSRMDSVFDESSWLLADDGRPEIALAFLDAPAIGNELLRPDYRDN